MECPKGHWHSQTATFPTVVLHVAKVAKLRVNFVLILCFVLIVLIFDARTDRRSADTFLPTLKAKMNLPQNECIILQVNSKNYNSRSFRSYSYL